MTEDVTDPAGIASALTEDFRDAAETGIVLNVARRRELQKSGTPKLPG